MIPLINHDSQWGRSEVVIIPPDSWSQPVRGLIHKQYEIKQGCYASNHSESPEEQQATLNLPVANVARLILDPMRKKHSDRDQNNRLLDFPSMAMA